MKNASARRYLASASLIGLMLTLAVPARATGLTLFERVKQVSYSNVVDNSHNRAIADTVAKELGSSPNLQQTVDALSDENIAIFAAYYLPSGNSSVSSPGRNSKVAAASLATSNSCYSYSNTVRATNIFGSTIAQVSVYGTWCSNGTAVVSAPNVSSNYALGSTIGWQLVRKQPDLSGFNSSQARFLAAYDFELVLGPVQTQPLTICSKLYGNVGGAPSGSSSCVF